VRKIELVVVSSVLLYLLAPANSCLVVLACSY
jgi:hypothetical protein